MAIIKSVLIHAAPLYSRNVGRGYFGREYTLRFGRELGNVHPLRRQDAVSVLLSGAALQGALGPTQGKRGVERATRSGLMMSVMNSITMSAPNV